MRINERWIQRFAKKMSAIVLPYSADVAQWHSTVGLVGFFLSPSLSVWWSDSTIMLVIPCVCDDGLARDSLKSWLRLCQSVHYVTHIVMPSSQRHGQDKTIRLVLSLSLHGVNRIGDKSRLFSVLLTAFRDWTKQFRTFLSPTVLICCQFLSHRLNEWMNEWMRKFI